MKKIDATLKSNESRKYVQNLFRRGLITPLAIKEAGEIFESIESLKSPQKEEALVELIMSRCFKDVQSSKAA